MSHDEKACVNCGEDRSGEATYPTCETCGAGGRQRVVQDTYFCDACFEDFRSGEEGRWKGIGSKMPKRVTSEDPSNHGPLCARRRGEPVCLCPRPSEALPDFGPCLRCDLPSVQEEPRRCALHLERRGKCPPNAQCLACDRLGYHIEPRPRAASDDPTEHYCAACKDTGCSECADRRTMETPQGECWICGRTVSNATGVKLTPSGKLECNDAQTGSCPRSETATHEPAPVHPGDHERAMKWLRACYPHLYDLEGDGDDLRCDGHLLSEVFAEIRQEERGRPTAKADASNGCVHDWLCIEADDQAGAELVKCVVCGIEQMHKYEEDYDEAIRLRAALEEIASKTSDLNARRRAGRALEGDRPLPGPPSPPWVPGYNAPKAWNGSEANVAAHEAEMRRLLDERIRERAIPETSPVGWCEGDHGCATAPLACTNCHRLVRR
jgi:hypothetical protein